LHPFDCHYVHQDTQAIPGCGLRLLDQVPEQELLASLRTEGNLAE